MPCIRDIADMIGRRRPRRNRTRGGFTLIELLVAMAIFVTVMSGVTLLFNGAIRASKQGFQNQDAFEIARGAMDILERDLSRSFTSRDHGDVYNFYGTPIGFTFVGMITAEDFPIPNLARVTYVMYHVPTSVQNIAGAVSMYRTVHQIDVPTYNLIRYIEPGAEDLESFPVDWTATLDPDDTAVDLPLLLQMAVNDSTCGDAACEDEVVKAKKRELWIRMLSGGDEEVPSAWGRFGIFADLELDPFDYVIAENFRHLSLLLRTGDPLTDRDNDGDPEINDPDDHIVSALDDQPSPQLVFPMIFLSDTADFNPNLGRVPFFTYREFGTRNRRDALGRFIQKLDPVTGLPLYADPPFNSIPIYETEVAPIELRYWNDTRNLVLASEQAEFLLTNEFDDDNDGFPDNPEEANGINLGSPLDARAPVEVVVNFTLFFESTYVGAPDFNQRFTMRIDLPTGYRRTFQTPVEPVAPVTP